jgi:hypothetical protein
MKAEQKYQKQKKKTMIKCGLDPKNPASDQIIEERLEMEESEKEESGDEDAGSDIEVTSDMDIFDIIKLSKEKES